MESMTTIQSIAKEYGSRNTLHRVLYFGDGDNWLVEEKQIGPIDCWQKVRVATEYDLAFFADNPFPTTMAEVEKMENES